MNKSNWLTLGISFVVLLTVVVIILMFLLPQQSVVVDASTLKYEAVKKSDYVYEQTKNITRDALVKEYTITNEQMDSFKNNHQYVSGNSDPFTPRGTNTDSSTNTNKNNTSSNSSSSTNTNNSNSNTSISEDTTQKITNSNGGVANPPSTNK